MTRFASLAPLTLLPLLALAGACTTLGPMPATTGISAQPVGRPGVEAQAGAMPGFFLSDAASDHTPQPVGQLSGLVEPDRWLGLPGLIVGARQYGASGDAAFEPFVGYRKRLEPDGPVSVAGILFGTSAHATDQLATYQATRTGAELAVDSRLGAPSPWFSLHLQGALTATAMWAHGTYCVDPQGQGTDCDTTTSSNNTVVDGTMSGIYGTATAMLSADFTPRHSGLHLVRLAILGSAGSMPTLVNGEQQTAKPYGSIGLALTVGVGPAD
jgi:hypothetical protein